MNYTDIIMFLEIVSCSSLSKAAENLYITQPTLSHRLTSLEKELNTQLVVRQKGVRNIELTESGKRFIPIAKKWQNLWQESQTINFEQPIKHFRISNVDSLNICFMPQVYMQFIKEHNNCSLSLSTLRSNACYQAIENHEIDFALITNPHFFRKVHTRALFHEKMKFICNIDASYEDTVSPEKLRIENEIFIPWSNPFLLWHDYWFGNMENKRISLDNMCLFEEFMQLDNAWAVVPSSIAYSLEKKKSIRICQITNPPDDRTCYGIYDDRWNHSPLLSDMYHTIIHVVEKFPDITITSHTAPKSDIQRVKK